MLKFEKISVKNMKAKYVTLLLLVISFICGKVSAQGDAEPLVIHTAARNYDQPTLDEYQKCFQSSVICKDACAGENTANRTLCEAECPICPILINQRVMVQGVNDTNYQPPVATSSNITNVIRVTNEIHNNLQQRLSETDHNNLSHISQNLTGPVGDFGMGVNANGSCCIVIRPSKNCEVNQLKSTLECHTKRRLVCGNKCTARVMYAKSVVHCKREEDGNEVCARRIEYVPYEERQYEDQKQAPQLNEPKCYFVPNWPYVSCVKERPSASICRRCLQLPYGYVLNKGLPTVCIYCLSESSLFAGHHELDLFTLRNDESEGSDDQHVPAFEKYFDEHELSHMFDDVNFDFEPNQRSPRNARRHQKNRKN